MSSTITESTNSTLNGLIETCKDGAAGFRDAAENVKNAEYQTLFSELAEERSRFALELQALVGNAGGTPETSGSFAAAVHRGWMDLKGAITRGDEHAILVECERGEDSAVAEYREALENPDLSPNARGFLRSQYAAVQSAHDRVRDLRDRFTS
jgi:uncharacterized protein (TIGR02284 family)